MKPKLLCVPFRYTRRRVTPSRLLDVINRSINYSQNCRSSLFSSISLPLFSLLLSQKRIQYLHKFSLNKTLVGHTRKFNRLLFLRCSFSWDFSRFALYHARLSFSDKSILRQQFASFLFCRSSDNEMRNTPGELSNHAISDKNNKINKRKKKSSYLRTCTRE